MRGFGVRVRAYVHACVRWMHFAVAGGFACMHACAGCIVHEGRANARHPCSARAHTAHGAMRALPRPRTCPTEARCPRHALIARAWPGAGAAHAAKTSGGGGAGGTAAACREFLCESRLHMRPGSPFPLSHSRQVFPMCKQQRHHLVVKYYLNKLIHMELAYHQHPFADKSYNNHLFLTA